MCRMVTHRTQVRDHPALAVPCLQAMFDLKGGEEAAWPCISKRYIEALDNRSLSGKTMCESKDERRADANKQSRELVAAGRKKKKEESRR